MLRIPENAHVIINDVCTPMVFFSLSDLSHYQKAPQLAKQQVTQSFLCLVALTGVASQVLLLLVTPESWDVRMSGLSHFGDLNTLS